jgi:acetyl-CoA carboxylase carboxyl transferase subunit alpha
MSAYDKVLAARASDRAMGSFYIGQIIDDFIELHGDRSFGDDGAIVGGVGYLDKRPVTVIAMHRGESLEERMKRNFGCPSPEGYRKALRLMKQAEKFGRPVICFVGSPGAYCGITAEERGQGQAIAQNLWEMAALEIPILTVVTGEGGSGGALALSVSDKMIMLEDAVYSVGSPEGCATILWKDAGRAKEAAELLRLTSEDLRQMGVADAVLEEKGKSPEQIAKELKKMLVSSLKEMDKLRISVLLASRYRRYRRIGDLWN